MLKQPTYSFKYLKLQIKKVLLRHFVTSSCDCNLLRLPAVKQYINFACNVSIVVTWLVWIEIVGPSIGKATKYIFLSTHLLHRSTYSTFLARVTFSVWEILIRHNIDFIYFFFFSIWCHNHPLSTNDHKWKSFNLNIAELLTMLLI